MIQDGPPSSRRGVVLAGDERWLPGAVGSELEAYVEQGGHILSLGIDSLRRPVAVASGQATDPGPPGPRTTCRPGPARSSLPAAR